MKLILISINFAVLFETLIYNHVNSAVVDPIVTISQGKLKGKIDQTRNGRSFAQYLGIPYVKKPDRFLEGGIAPKWDGVRDGTKFGSPCPQFDRKSKMAIGNEDCLFINVFTPEIGGQEGTKGGVSKNKLRPVIVHIHGGSFVSQQSGLYGPQYLLDEDIVFVSFNYRLGVFGFLSTGDKEMVANLGLRDQIQALKWVQQNIHYFNGNPSLVTLLGTGSGGALSSYLTLSPASKGIQNRYSLRLSNSSILYVAGLFTAVVSTSGNSICTWAVVHNPAKVAAKLATKLNCPNVKTSAGIVSCLKGKSIKDIEIARVSLQGTNEDPAVPFAPVVESWLAKDLFGNPVIPDKPEKLMSTGNYIQVPWLTGVNSLNGINLAVATVVTTPKRLSQLDQEWNKVAPITFHYSQTSANPLNVSEKIREHYFGTKNISTETKDKLIYALTDRNYIHCTAKAAAMQSKFNPVYLYNLNYIGASSFLDDWGLREKLNMKGVVLGDELQHIFNLKVGNFPILKKGDTHYPFSDKMIKLLTTFAQNGKPMELTDKSGAEWSPVAPNTPTSKLLWYNLDSASLSRPISFDERRQSKLWDQLDLDQSTDKNLNKFAVGYEKTTAKPTPIVPTAGSSKSKVNTPSGLKTFQSTSKPDALTPLKPEPLTPLKPQNPSLSYSLAPTPTVTTSKSVSSPTPSTQKPSVNISPPAISSVLKDDDPYSSTTTTTTKKPGFFSKLIG